jgi:S1-C subfamily serine protease
VSRERRWTSTLRAAAELSLFWVLFAWAPSAHAEASPAQRRLTFVGLRQLSGWATPIRFSPTEFNTSATALLRSAGLNATDPGTDVGSDLALVGSIEDLECKKVDWHLNCQLSVLWQVFENGRKTPLYSTRTSALLLSVESDSIAQVKLSMVTKSLTSLLRRARFKKLGSALPRLTNDTSAPEATFARCLQPALALPASAEETIRATVVLQSSSEVGSGFFLNGEGLLLTAAHVVVGAGDGLVAKLGDGQTHAVGLVRINRAADVALLRMTDGTAPRCLELASRPPSLGADVYAIGSSGGAQQAFSVSRGIVSGKREFGGIPVLQTDASISPGNSGGPLLGAEGKALAVVSFKVVGRGVEGVAFGIPIAQALSALGLVEGKASAAELDQIVSLPPESPTVYDADDAIQSLTSLPRVVLLPPPVSAPPLAAPAESASKGAERQSDPEQKRRLTVGVSDVMKWGGLVVGAAGLVGVLISYEGYKPGVTTQKDYDSLQTWNDMSWVACGLGAASFGVSFSIKPARTTSPTVSSAQRSPGLVLVQIANHF